MGESHSVLEGDVIVGPDGLLEDARCRGVDADLFFGPPGNETRGERLRRESVAKSLCRECPALLACRDYALEHGEVYGVWGGLGEQERRTYLARLGRLRTSA
jgi:WhiB family redox-sensing transcriptional regulator